jgi:hypothetical protein
MGTIWLDSRAARLARQVLEEAARDAMVNTLSVDGVSTHLQMKSRRSCVPTGASYPKRRLMPVSLTLVAHWTTWVGPEARFGKHS